MSDNRLRELQRRLDGSVESEAAYIKERLRVGDLSMSSLILASECGHPAAQLLEPRSVTTRWSPVEGESILSRLVLYYACAATQPVWNMHVRVPHIQSWFEKQGGKTHQWFDDEHHRQLVLEASIWKDGVHHQKTMTSPSSVHAQGYPTFHDSQPWYDLINSLREDLFLADVHLQANPETKRLIVVVWDLLANRRRVELFRNYYNGGLDPNTMEIGWVYHLLRYMFNDSEQDFMACLAVCYEHIVPPELTKIINKEIAQWTLR